MCVCCSVFMWKPSPSIIQTSVSNNCRLLYTTIITALLPISFLPTVALGNCAYNSQHHQFLTHQGWIMHIGICKLDHHWFRKWLVFISSDEPFLNQCWIIGNWTLGNLPQGIIYHSNLIFIHYKASHEKVITKKGAHFVSTLIYINFCAMYLLGDPKL